MDNNQINEQNINTTETINIVENLVTDTEIEFIDQTRTIFPISSEFEFIGTEIQRIKMFESWAKYFSKVKNPQNTVLNTFFKTKYAALDSVLDSIREVLGENGLSIIQAPFISSNGDPGVKTIVIHKDGGILSLPIVTAKAIKNDVQGIIASISYMRRVVINAVAGVIGSNEDDDGQLMAEQQQQNDNNNNKKKPQKPKQEITPLKKKMIELCTEKAKINRELVNEIVTKRGKILADIIDENDIQEIIDEVDKIN